MPSERAESAKYALRAAEAAFKRIQDGPRPEIVAQSRAQVELQRQRWNLITDRLEKFTIRAPFHGFVSAKFSEVGAWIKQGDPIAEIVQMDNVEVEAQVTAELVIPLRLGDVIRVEFPELPNELWTGKIDRIVPRGDGSRENLPRRNPAAKQDRRWGSYAVGGNVGPS